MRIVINTSHQRFGGAIQVALSFINECKKLPENEYHVWVGPGVKKSLDKASFPSNFYFYEFDFGVIGFKTIPIIQKELSTLEKKINPDCIIATSGPSYFHSKAPQIIGFNLPLYIYPESPYVKQLSLQGKLKLRLKKWVHYFYFKRDATVFVVQTDDVNARVKKAFKNKEVVTVSNTCNHYFENPIIFENKLPLRQNKEIRLLTLSSYYSHKNFEIIPLVANELGKRGITNVKFITTLKDADFDKHIQPHPFIVNVGPVQPEQCPSLYTECDMMFLPTLAECFSASYPEAMVMEKPIITTDLGFAKSICGEAALYFKAKDYKSAADTIQLLIGNATLSKELIEKGKIQLKKFDTPEVRATKYIDLCKKVSETKKYE